MVIVIVLMIVNDKSNDSDNKGVYPLELVMILNHLMIISGYIPFKTIIETPLTITMVIYHFILVTVIGVMMVNDRSNDGDNKSLRWEF